MLLTRTKPLASFYYVWERELGFDQISKLCTQCVLKKYKNESMRHNDHSQPRGSILWTCHKVFKNSEIFGKLKGERFYKITDI